MLTNLDALVIALYVRIDDFLLTLPPRTRTGRPPQITDSELICLAIAQMFLGIPDDRRFLAVAGYRVVHLFPYVPNNRPTTSACARSDRGSRSAPGGQLALVR